MARWENLAARLGSFKVDTNGCHVWLGARFTAGYGAIHVGGKEQYVHRVIYELRHGKISTDLQIDHLCRNRACANIDHLEVVSQTENVRRGAATRLSLSEVREIRKILRFKSQTDVAKVYGFSSSNISRIERNKIWIEWEAENAR